MNQLNSFHIIVKNIYSRDKCWLVIIDEFVKTCFLDDIQEHNITKCNQSQVLHGCLNFSFQNKSNISHVKARWRNINLQPRTTCTKYLWLTTIPKCMIKTNLVGYVTFISLGPGLLFSFIKKFFCKLLNNKHCIQNILSYSEMVGPKACKTQSCGIGDFWNNSTKYVKKRVHFILARVWWRQYIKKKKNIKST